MRFILGSIGLLGIALTIASAAPVLKGKSDADKLIGTWKLVRSDQGVPENVQFFVELTRDGKMSLRVEPTGPAPPILLKGTYKHEGDKIDYTLQTQQGTEKQEVLTIQKLTETELVTVDPEGIKEEFERVKVEKKEK
jgi:uncharacterized protein (TIGR03066 family)